MTAEGLAMPRSERGLDATGKLITGESFPNIVELKRIIVDKRKEDFYRCLTEKLMTYALGRKLEYSDAPVVDLNGDAGIDSGANLGQRRTHFKGAAGDIDQLRSQAQQRVGNGGEQLRHLHEGSFERAQRLAEQARFARQVLVARHNAACRHARRRRADAGAHPGIAVHPAGETVALAAVVLRAVIHAFRGLPAR